MNYTIIDLSYYIKKTDTSFCSKNVYKISKIVISVSSKDERNLIYVITKRDEALNLTNNRFFTRMFLPSNDKFNCTVCDYFINLGTHLHTYFMSHH